MRFLVLGLLFLSLAYVQSEPGNICTSNEECDDGECCEILSEVQVTSKRQIDPSGTPEKTGTCGTYIREGQFCLGYEEMNGNCGCSPGLHCYGRFEPSTNGRKRGIPYIPGYTFERSCEAN